MNHDRITPEYIFEPLFGSPRQWFFSDHQVARMCWLPIQEKPLPADEYRRRFTAVYNALEALPTEIGYGLRGFEEPLETALFVMERLHLYADRDPRIGIEERTKEMTAP